MKKLSLYIFLVLMWCNAGFAEESFSIDGMSLGDSALRYFTEKEIKEKTENIYENNLYTQFNSKSNSSSSEYDLHQIHYKSEDKNYIIEVISGVKWTESFDQCKRLKEKIKKELTVFFSNIKIEWIDQDYERDTGKTSASFFYFDNGDSVDVHCKDWNSTVEFRDNLRVSLMTLEFDKFITPNN